MKTYQINSIKCFLLYLVFCLRPSSAFSQQQAANWYFGQKCALTFTSGAAQVLGNSAMCSGEACASISNANGNLLFYSDGDTIWTANHQVMANGTGLLGSNNAMQGVQIVKWPGNQNLFYVFTLNDNWPVWDLNYSVVDMSLAAGAGSVTTKNVLVQSLVSEHLAFTKHCNGTDIWLATTTYSSNILKAYLISAIGINTVAVNSTLGGFFASAGMQGQMKFSPHGNKLGFVSSSSSQAPNYFGLACLCDFNSLTGTFTNALLLDSLAGAMGAAFSSDGSKFYATHYTNQTAISQWNLCAGNSTAIVASQYSMAAVYPFLYQLQLAPNGQIIGGPSQGPSLAVINFPNAQGAACGYSANAILLGNSINTSGLPNFEGTLIKAPVDSFEVTLSKQSCQTLSFSVGATAACQQQLNPALSFSWNFGEPSSANFNVSTQANPTHRYANAGVHLVTLTYVYPCSTASVAMSVTVDAEPSILINNSASPTITTCAEQTVSLVASGAASYSWSNGASSNTVLITQVPSTMIVQAFSTKQCVSTKTLTIKTAPCVGGQEQLEAPMNVIIAPNPFTEGIRVKLEQDRDLEIKLYDAFGRIVYANRVEQKELHIPTSMLPAGIYFMQCENYCWRLVKVE